VGGGKKSLEEGVTGRGGGGAAALGFAASGFSLGERADAAEVLRGAVERERASVVDEIRVVGGLLDAGGGCNCNWASAEVSRGVSEREVTGSGCRPLIIRLNHFFLKKNSSYFTCSKN